MNINYFKLTTILLLISSTFFLSCISEKSKAENALVGTWRSTTENGRGNQYWFQFKDDNSYLAGKGVSVNLDSKWEIDIESNSILLYNNKGKLSLKTKYIIISNTLTLFDIDDGDDLRLVKSKE